MAITDHDLTYGSNLAKSGPVKSLRRGDIVYIAGMINTKVYDGDDIVVGPNDLVKLRHDYGCDKTQAMSGYERGRDLFWNREDADAEWCRRRKVKELRCTSTE